MKKQNIALDIRISPYKRTKDDGILEALAFMDGNDLHGLFIAFKPNLLFIGSHSLCTLLLYKPPQECYRSQPFSDRFTLKEFREMKNVGQATLTIGTTKKTLFDMFPSHELPEHPDKAVGMPDFMIVPEALDPYSPFIFILDESIQILPICSHHIRSQGASYKSFAIRIGNTLQYPFHLHCFTGIKDIFLHMEDTGNAYFRERVLNKNGLPVRSYQNGDISFMDGFDADESLPFPAQLKQPCYLRCHGTANQRSRPAFRQAFCCR